MATLDQLTIVTSGCERIGYVA